MLYQLSYTPMGNAKDSCNVIYYTTDRSVCQQLFFVSFENLVYILTESVWISAELYS